jgi:hypothetical protein
MREKQDALLFLELLIITITMVLLSAVAIPHAGHMMYEEKMASRENEYNQIRTAVSEMLDDSAAGRLESVGPTADMSLVRTCDSPPLVLVNYLPGFAGRSVKLVCLYGFTADGTILQVAP